MINALWHVIGATVQALVPLAFKKILAFAGVLVLKTARLSWLNLAVRFLCSG